MNTAKWSLPGPDGTTAPGATAVTTASWTRNRQPTVARAARHGRQGRAQPLLAALRVTADVRRQVHLVRARLGDDPADLVDNLTRTDDQAAAPVTETGVHVAEAVGEERPPVGGTEPGARHGVVLYEQRDHLVGGGQGRVQRRVVVQPQIGGEQNHRHTHAVPPSDARPAARAMLRAMPPKTTAWKGDTLHQ